MSSTKPNSHKIKITSALAENVGTSRGYYTSRFQPYSSPALKSVPKSNSRSLAEWIISLSLSPIHQFVNEFHDELSFRLFHLAILLRNRFISSRIDCFIKQ